MVVMDISLSLQKRTPMDQNRDQNKIHVQGRVSFRTSVRVMERMNPALEEVEQPDRNRKFI